MEIVGIQLETLELDNIGSWPLILRKLSVCAVCVIVFFLGYLLDLSDKLVELRSASQSVEKLSATFKEQQNAVANLESYQKEVKIVSESLEQLTEQLPQSSEEAGLLEDISQQAVSHNLQFIKIKPAVSENKGFYTINPVELVLSGDYNGFSDFASNIANMPRIVTLQNFEIKKNTSEGKGPLIMTLHAQTYWSLMQRHNK